MNGGNNMEFSISGNVPYGESVSQVPQGLNIYRRKAGFINEPQSVGLESASNSASSVFGKSIFSRLDSKRTVMNDGGGSGGNIYIACCCSFGGSNTVTHN